MSLDKSIEHGKEKRKPYYGAKAIAKSCRNHGGGAKYQCDWCLGNRMHKNRVREAKHNSREEWEDENN